MGLFTINRLFLPIKLHYGLFSAGTATVQPTMPVYAKVLGFSSYIVGIIYTILPILGLVIKPAFGALADKFKWHRSVLVYWVIVITAVYFGVWFIPPAHPFEKSLSTCSTENSVYLHSDKNDSTWTCSIKPNETMCTSFWQGDCTLMDNPVKFDNCTKCEDADTSVDETFSQWQFWLFLVLLVFAWGGTSVVTTLNDTICIEICKDPNLYGKQRLWGSLTWGIFCVINGFVIDAVSEEGKEKNYAPAFYLMIPPLVIDIFVSYKLKFEIPQQSENIAKDVWRVMLKPRNIFFSIWCILVGVSFAIVWNFLFWHVEDLAAIQGPAIENNIKTIEGLIAGIETFIGETPAFFLGGWILNKIGHGHSMALVFCAIGLRYTLYSVLVNPWWCLPIEILQNNYGLFYSTMTSYAKVYAPPGTEATMQSILCAACEGIGVAIGSYLGGYCYDKYGGSQTFLIFGIFFFIVAVICEIAELVFKYLERNESTFTINPIGEENPAFES